MAGVITPFNQGVRHARGNVIRYRIEVKEANQSTLHVQSTVAKYALPNDQVSPARQRSRSKKAMLIVLHCRKN